MQKLCSFTYSYYSILNYNLFKNTYLDNLILIIVEIVGYDYNKTINDFKPLVLSVFSTDFVCQNNTFSLISGSLSAFISDVTMHCFTTLSIG
jgi:hypothetical protein